MIDHDANIEDLCGPSSVVRKLSEAINFGEKGASKLIKNQIN